jgi:hypothetical protein
MPVAQDARRLATGNPDRNWLIRAEQLQRPGRGDHMLLGYRADVLDAEPLRDAWWAESAD